MKLKNKFLGLLSLLRIRDSATVKAVTKAAQSFSGVKTLADMASSPNSTDDIDAMPMTEVITHLTMQKYLSTLTQPPQEAILIPVDDNEVDELIGGGDSTGGGGSGDGNFLTEDDAPVWDVRTCECHGPTYRATGECIHPIDVKEREIDVSTPSGSKITINLPETIMRTGEGLWPVGTTVTGGGDNVIVREVDGGVKIYVKGR